MKLKRRLFSLLLCCSLIFGLVPTGVAAADGDGKVTVFDTGGDTQTQPVDSEIYVERVENLSDDFISGMDVSSYVSLGRAG